jgi:peptide/nickel transport system permease protein
LNAASVHRISVDCRDSSVLQRRFRCLVSILVLSAILLSSTSFLAADTDSQKSATSSLSEGSGDYSVAPASVAWAQDHPVADAGNDSTVYSGGVVFLNGSGSNPTGLNYTWNFTYDGDEQVLYGMYANFTFRKPGLYVITLTVRDSANQTATDTMQVAVLAVQSWWDRNSAKVVAVAIVTGVVAVIVASRWIRNHALITPLEIEKLQLRIRDARRIMALYSKNLGGKIGFAILAVFIFLAVFADFLITHEDPNSIKWADVNEDWLPPSWLDDPTDWEFPLGTAEFGKDVYSMTVLGTRASLVVGILASLISIVIGAGIGITSGYFGKISDEILMRFTDFFLVIPWFPLMIVLASLMGRTFTNVIIVIGITSWPSTARIVRAQVLSVKEKAFVERARSVGAKDSWILQKHIMPNVFPLIFANTILLIANSIFSEAFLDFFGLGDPSVLSWGIMLENAYQQGAFLRFAWWYIAAPGMSIVMLIMAFYLVGDALDEVLNPKLRKR